AGMPVVGLLLGRGLADAIGRQASWLAAVLLAAAGVYAIIQARSGGAGAPSRSSRPLALAVTGLALSADNLIVGFALGTYQVSVAGGAIVFGAVSTAMSLAGLEVGARLGRIAGEKGELAGGVVLVGIGVAIGLGAFS